MCAMRITPNGGDASSEPVLELAPGESSQACRTAERCPVGQLEAGAGIFFDTGRGWIQ